MKPTFSDLTAEQQATYGNGCGLSARFLNVPDFIFTASCRHHDFNYERGGHIGYKIKADWDFFARMLDDALWYDEYKCGYVFISCIYFIGVVLNPISYFAFSYGRWRSIEEILKRDEESKV